ncbi:hypothetical protein FJTKL_00925 [Diaporthe vaccinii]|uniref:Uncharacterized protein n=1 Tax=Diaporthe vaccinii TaxID=105482 RepID=A0ABR4E1U9_9PEZI
MPGSLSFPTGHNELEPPGDAGLNAPQNGALAGPLLANCNRVASATPPATTGAQQTGSGLTPTLQNIVATVNLDCRLDLKTIALHARNAEYKTLLLYRAL